MTLTTVTLVAAVSILVAPPAPAHASSGDQVWLNRYNDPLGPPDFAYYEAVSPDGSRVFTAGWSQTNIDDYLTIAYDAGTGEMVLTRSGGRVPVSQP